MAIKKKVTYSVSYVAGTDTLTTKLNSLLDDIVSLIVGHTSGLTVLDRITVGSTRFTGAPLYDTYDAGLYAAWYQNRHYESDVIFVGTSANNVCLSFGFFDGNLVVAMNMTPAVEKLHTDVWDSKYGASGWLPFYAIGRMSRWFADLQAMGGNYAIPYSVVDNTISLGIIYWDSEYSRGYTFCTGGGQSDGVDLVIFQTDEGSGQTGIGAAIWAYGQINSYRNGLGPTIFTFSFAENLSDNMADALHFGYYYPPLPTADKMQMLNSRYDWRLWGSQYQDYDGQRQRPFVAFHSLCGSSGRMGGYTAYLEEMNRVNLTWDCVSPDNFLSALCLPYNLPHLTPGQAYVRKMRIPGWNPECKGEIYLFWSPVTSAYQSGDILEIGNKQYAIITPGAVCWAARVA